MATKKMLHKEFRFGKRRKLQDYKSTENTKFSTFFSFCVDIVTFYIFIAKGHIPVLIILRSFDLFYLSKLTESLKSVGQIIFSP